MTAPAAVTIDRLSLHAGGLSEANARRLAQLVGMALGRLVVAPAMSSVGNVSVQVPAQEGRTVEQLAAAVVHAIETALLIDGVGE